MSQLRICVKCAFGQLNSRWGVLRSAIPVNITIVKTVALVNCLARLHNFSVDKVGKLCEVSLDEETVAITVIVIVERHWCLDAFNGITMPFALV